MTDEHNHTLRALLLASLVALSVVAGGVALAGTTAAAEHHGLTASDGAGGNASVLIAGFDDQFPDGVDSDDDTLRVEATNESFPTEFQGELRLPDSDITFADNQRPEDVELVVIDERGNEKRASQNEGIEVTRVGADSVAFNVSNDGLLSSDPVAVEIRSLRFDPGNDDTGTLRWTVNGENATHDLRVEPFEPYLTATDENGGDSAAVTAGAENQTMFGAATGTTSDPAHNLVLQGDEAELPSQFVATISLEGEDVDFHDRNNGDITATSPDGNAFVPDKGVSATEIRVEVARFDGTDENATIIELDGVTFDVPPNATDADVTWEISGKTASYGLLPDRVDARFTESHAVPRGLDGTPENGATVEITSKRAFTTGLHDSDENISVTIPADRRENLSFDTTAETTATLESSGDLLGSEAAVTVEENRLLVSVDKDINDSETITLSNVRFNTSGFEGAADAETADFRSGLTVVTVPVNNGSFDPVEVSTSNNITVGTPEITVEGNGTQLDSGANSTTGTEALSVRINDTTGHQISPGSDIVVNLDGDEGLAFDTGQSLTVDGTLSDSTSVAVSENAVVVSVDEDASPTAAGDSLVIEGTDGDGIRFDTTDATDGDSASFSVETNAGDAPVVQSTDTVATVSEPGLSVDRSTLPLADNQTVTATVVDADGQPVEGTDVSITNEALGVDETVTTDSDGMATVTLDLADADTVETIDVTTTVDDRQLAETVETADISTNVSRLPAGEKTTVDVTIETSADGAESDVEVDATADAFAVDDGTATTDENGSATFSFAPDTGGDISLDATVDDAALDTVVTSVPPTMAVSPDSITAGNESTVEVTIEALDAPDGEMAPQSGVPVNATSEQYDIDRDAETNDSGVATFTFNVSDDAGSIEFSTIVDGIGLADAVTVSDSSGGSTNETNETDETGDTENRDDDDDQDTGGGPSMSMSSGAQQSAGEQDPEADITVTNASLSATEITVGDSVEVTADVENRGNASGERNVSVRVNDISVASEPVALDAGDSGTITATLSFETDGEREIRVGDVVAGTIVVGNVSNGGTSDNRTSTDEPSAGPDVEPPAGAVAFDAQEIVDAAPEQEGVEVEFENVRVESITFVEDAAGQAVITQMDELPDGVPETPGELLMVMEITVPDTLSDEQATIRFTLNESQMEVAGGTPESIRLGHYTDGGWDSYQPELVSTEGGEYVYESEVPGFSLYSVYAQDSAEQTAADETQESPVGEQAGLVDSPITAVLGFIGIIALVLSIAGARMYQQNDSL